MVAIEAVARVALCREGGALLVAAAGAGDGPAIGGQARRQRLRRIAEPETEEMPWRGGHECRSAEAAARSDAGADASSRAAAMRLCLRRVSSQKPQETNAPI